MICAQCATDIAAATACSACGESPLLDGRYRLEEVVGHGAHGTTYRATEISTDRVVAIKELLVRKVQSLKAIDLFEREVRVLKELSHPGVPEFIEDLNVDAGRSVALYLVQEFIDGGTLAAEFEGRRGTADDVFLLAAELLDTLAYLHALSPPVIHRDIKPGNVMRRRANDELVLIDFGAVRDAVDTAEGGSTVAGTFGYMAPEQFMGRAIPATDIYGVGATIVALLARQDPQQLMSDGRTIEWEEALQLRARYRRLLRKMLEPDADKRAGDAGLLALEIRAAVENTALEAPEPTLPAPEPTTGLFVEDLDIPPAPRQLPRKFTKTHAVGAAFHRNFGLGFAVATMFATVVPLMVGVAEQEVVPFLMALMFMLIFGGITATTLPKGFRQLNGMRHAYRQGLPTEAIVMATRRSSYKVNERSAHIYDYEYAIDGTVYKGELHSWDGLALDVGSHLAVLYDPSNPGTSVVYDPSHYSASLAARREMALRAQRQREEVVFDLSEREELDVEEEDKQTVDASW